MAISFRRKATVFVFAVIAACNHAQAAEQKPKDGFYMKKTKWFPICQEIDEIIRLELNEGYVSRPPPWNTPLGHESPEWKEYKKRVYRPFTIPPSYKNFTFPKWLAVDIEEVKSALPHFYEINKATPVWVENAEKSEIDVDNDGKVDVLYRLNKKEFRFNENTPNKNEQEFNRHPPPHGSFAFFYKGRFYFSSHGGAELVIYEPTQVGKDMGYYLNYVCVWKPYHANKNKQQE